MILWLAAGALAFVPHLLATLSCAGQRPGFDHLRQFLSELGERGSATAAAFNFLGVLPTGALYLAFGLGLVAAYRSERLLQLSGALIALHGACRAAAAVLACDAGCRPAFPSASQVAHNAAASLGLVALTAALFVAAAWLVRRREPVATIVSSHLLGLLALGAQVGLLAGPAAAAGLFQRVALGALELWVVVLALHIGMQSAPVQRTAG